MSMNKTTSWLKANCKFAAKWHHSKWTVLRQRDLFEVFKTIPTDIAAKMSFKGWAAQYCRELHFTCPELGLFDPRKVFLASEIRGDETALDLERKKLERWEAQGTAQRRKQEDKLRESKQTEEWDSADQKRHRRLEMERKWIKDHPSAKPVPQQASSPAATSDDPGWERFLSNPYATE